MKDKSCFPAQILCVLHIQDSSKKMENTVSFYQLMVFITSGFKRCCSSLRLEKVMKVWEVCVTLSVCFFHLYLLTCTEERQNVFVSQCTFYFPSWHGDLIGLSTLNVVATFIILTAVLTDDAVSCPSAEFIEGVSQFSVKGDKEQKLRCKCLIVVCRQIKSHKLQGSLNMFDT